MEAPTASTRVTIAEVGEKDREVSIGGRRVVGGRTLASVLEELGGYSGLLTIAGTGERIPISLEQWRGRDPETTLLKFQVVTTDPAALPFRLTPAPDRE